MFKCVKCGAEVDTNPMQVTYDNGATFENLCNTCYEQYLAEPITVTLTRGQAIDVVIYLENAQMDADEFDHYEEARAIGAITGVMNSSIMTRTKEVK